MTIQELKQKIESNTVESPFYVFTYQESPFLPEQYYREIAKNLHINPTQIFSIEDLPPEDIFNTPLDLLYIYFTDKLTIDIARYKDTYNFIIICKDVDKGIRETYSDFIVDFPKLEKWQLEDYADSKLQGCDKVDIDTLVTLCPSIERLENEIQKILCFELPTERRFYLKKMLQEGALSDLSNFIIYDLSSAFIKRDTQKIKNILHDLPNIDIEPIGLVTVLYNNFKNIIKIQLANNPTSESTGLPSKQFWAIRNGCGKYTKEELIKIFTFLTDLDRQVKTGEISTSILIDYIVIIILGI